jgi:hypothetical protein
MSYNVTTIVRIEVTTTASSAHGDHEGHDNLLISCDLDIIANPCLNVPFASSEIPRRDKRSNRLIQTQLNFGCRAPGKLL